MSISTLPPRSSFLSPAPSPLGSDQFLSARVSTAKRSDRSQRPPQRSASAQVLEIVPEDGALRKHTASSYRSLSEIAKEKGRAVSSQSSSRRRTDWVLDLVQVGKGAESWGERDRVVLIVGSPSAESLAPILYNPAFADTLLLVGSIEPLPSIEALTSPSYLLQTSRDRTIYPTLQPFNLSGKPTGEAHPLPAIIQEATVLALQFRRSSISRTRAPVRRGSEDSNASTTPPRTPSVSALPLPGPPEAQARRSSDSGRSLDASKPGISKSRSDMSVSRPASRPRISSVNTARDSIFGSFSGRSKAEKGWTGGSPIDAVINFIPPASDFAPQRAMQDMLHQAVVLTTGILPVLTRRPGKPTQADPTPVSLIHVLPSQVPGPLPGVIENFLLGLVPKFAARSEREVWSAVTTVPAWLAPPRSVDNELYAASEVLLFGGVRCPIPADPEARSRAFLPNWGVCTMSPGAFGRSKTRQQIAVSTSTEPPSIGYDRTDARTPPMPWDQPATTAFSNNARTMYRDFSERVVPSPSTPELDPSSSSCSSVSGAGEVASPSGSEEGYTPAAPVEKSRKKGFAGWFKAKARK
ncbi:hypothetical protein DB88DRAFT_367812 [Papiliotrema laurentii]|uniref:Uncharacterized protein n=1 Tax=Papiliotrema laurentii TaxID=5418 RepID=A0AAD9CYE4_PAPLA|nr:hypothetical protein DB88DRAFT_367812 [Papiliotrema laurentii]